MLQKTPLKSQASSPLFCLELGAPSSMLPLSLTKNVGKCENAKENKKLKNKCEM